MTSRRLPLGLVGEFVGEVAQFRCDAIEDPARGAGIVAIGRPVTIRPGTQAIRQLDKECWCVHSVPPRQPVPEHANKDAGVEHAEERNLELFGRSHLRRLLLGGGGRCQVDTREVVAQRLDGLNPGIFDLSITKLSQCAFGHAREPGNLRKIGVLHLTEPGQDGGENFGLFHTQHSQPIYGLRQPTLGQKIPAYSQIWANAL